MYSSVHDLSGFEHLSPAAKCKAILTEVRAYVEIDKLLLSELRLPLLYESGVRYEFQGDVDRWKDAYGCLMTGKGSCNSLAAWRTAELQLYGEDASPYVQHQRVQRPDGSVMDLFHVIVRRGSALPDDHPQAWDDPSRGLGMPANDPSMQGARVVSAAGPIVTVGDAGAFVGAGFGEDVGAPCWGD